MMIQSTQDLVDVLVASAALHLEPGEGKFGEPMSSVDVVPPQTHVSYETVEGRRFQITVTEIKGT